MNVLYRVEKVNILKIQTSVKWLKTNKNVRTLLNTRKTVIYLVFIVLRRRLLQLIDFPEYYWLSKICFLSFSPNLSHPLTFSYVLSFSPYLFFPAHTLRPSYDDYIIKRQSRVITFVVCKKNGRNAIGTGKIGFRYWEP